MHHSIAMSPFLLSEANTLCEDTDLQTVEVSHSFAEQNPDLSKAKAVFLTVHDGRADFKFPKVVEEHVAAARPAFDQYLHLERDVGTREVVEAAMKQVKDAVGFHVLLPRGFVDLNREAAFALPVKVESEEVRQELERLYAQTRAVLMQLLGSVSAQVAVDVHSMAPYSPPPFEAPTMSSVESFGRYIADWNTVSPEKRRPVQIFHSVQVDEGGAKHMKPVTEHSVDFASGVAAELQAGGYQTSFTEPYTLVSGRHMSSVYLQRFPYSAAVDMPKDLLAVTNGSQNLRLDTAQVDQQKVQRVAACIVDTVNALLLRLGMPQS